ncbi:MAG: hypothetical protein R3303_11695 [Marinobacter sp.]|nr:hypothetical protein [Marinobacter sp.]
MLITGYTRVLLLALLCFIGIAPAYSAESTVTVSLWDMGASSMDNFDSSSHMGMAMSGTHMGMSGGHMAMGRMGIKLDTSSVPAGKVTFEVTNSSRVMVHEMVVAPVADKNTPLPYSRETQKVDEDKAGHLGEVAELEPGDSGALTLTLKPGTYILYCNIPGHYALGMWTLLEVRAN